MTWNKTVFGCALTQLTIHPAEILMLFSAWIMALRLSWHLVCTKILEVHYWKWDRKSLYSKANSKAEGLRIKCSNRSDWISRVTIRRHKGPRKWTSHWNAGQDGWWSLLRICMYFMGHLLSKAETASALLPPLCRMWRQI